MKTPMFGPKRQCFGQLWREQGLALAASDFCCRYCLVGTLQHLVGFGEQPEIELTWLLDLAVWPLLTPMA